MNDFLFRGNERGNILIVDRDTETIQSLSRLLADQGYDVRGVTEEKDALTNGETEFPDLIFIGNEFTVKSGLRITNALSKRSSSPAIPLIYIHSGNGKEDDRLNEFLEAGADYICKPFHAAEVLTRVDTHLQLKNLNGTLQQIHQKISNQPDVPLDRYGLIFHAIDNAKDRVVLADRDGRIVFLNETASKELGKPRHQIIDKYVADFDKNLAKEQWHKHFTALRKAGTTHKRAQLRDKDGREHTVDVHDFYLKYGNREYACAFGRKITDTERLQLTLKDFKNILDTIDSPIAVVSRDLLYRYANPAYMNIFSSEKQNIAGLPVSEIIGNTLFENVVREHYEECFSGRTVQHQLSLENGSAAQKILNVRYHPFCDASGKIIGALSNANDITDSYTAKKIQSDKGLLLDAFMDNIPANIYIKNQNDEHIYVNAQAEKTMGKNVDELLGTTTHDFFEKEIADKLVALDKKVLSETERSTTHHKFEVKDVDNGNKILLDNKFPIRSADGETLLGGLSYEIISESQKEHMLLSVLEEIQELKSGLEGKILTLRQGLREYERHHEIIGKSSSLNACISDAQYVAKEDTTVLIVGETGTGKELFARAIHSMSPRAHRSMVTVNCAALPANLIESELFGREKGAYTGAMTRQQGRFELADGATIFLDEIGDLPLELQSKLLRVLETGEFERLGSNKSTKVDVRVIAATNQDLKKLVREDRFRKDLFFRLNVFPISIPPLVERRIDIPLLAYSFVDEFNFSMGKAVSAISPEDLDYLSKYSWPGNVRELRNIIERSMIRASGSELSIRKTLDPLDAINEYNHDQGKTLADVERSHILSTLKQTKWRVSGDKGAAKILGLKATTLDARMKKLGIKRPTQSE